MTTRILTGDVREMLDLIPSNTFDCVVTSPPYWGLRDYGTARWEGGDPNCDHRSPTMRDGRNEDRTVLAGSAATNSGQLLLAHRSGCGKCGAVKVDQQIGLEPTLGEHIGVMVDVFRDVRRVMKPEASLWLNYGDCYATSPNGRSAADTKAAGNDDRTFRDKPFSTIGGALKAKDLCMVPNRLAIALQEDGWWVRSEIIWGKSNPMPDSSGRYRPSTAHEKIFLLTRSRNAYYDHESVKLPAAEASISRWAQNVAKQEGSHRANAGGKTNGTLKAVGGPHAVDKQRGHSRRHAGFSDHWDRMSKEEQQANGRLLRNYEPAPLDVWRIATKPFKEAHFATFPPELAKRAIEAGCPLGGHVLDPFGGSGTVGLVADALGRDATLIELNPDYVCLAQKRLGHLPQADIGIFA